MLRFGSPRTNGARSAEAVPSVPCCFISISRTPSVTRPIGLFECMAQSASNRAHLLTGAIAAHSRPPECIQGAWIARNS
jgi:hypothetical protein